MNNYVTIDGKKYKVVSPNYSVLPEKAITVRQTVGAAVDRVHGPSLTRYLMVLRVVHASPESGYGTLSDLVASYVKQSDITFVNIDGTSYTSIFEKMGKPDAVNALLVWYKVPVEIVVT